MPSLSAILIAAAARLRIRPGDDVMNAPIPAPMMTTNSDGWMSTGKCPPAIANPPATAASTMKIPGRAMHCESTEKRDLRDGVMRHWRGVCEASP